MCRASKKLSAKSEAEHLSERKKNQEGNQQNDSCDSDFVFKTNTAANSSLPTIQVWNNGTKSGSDGSRLLLNGKYYWRRTFCTAAKCKEQMKKKLRHSQTDTTLYAYGQELPIVLIGNFKAEVESVSTGKRTFARFWVAKGKTKSRALLSLDTNVKLDTY